jgi:ABC-type transport system involved in multi-copper enzyme maturation permease subunit
MTTLARLSLRIQRFELVSVVLMIGVISVAALVVRSHLDAVGATPSCFAEFYARGPGSGPACGDAVQRFFEIDNGEAVPVMAAMAFAPLIAGLLLGVGLVSREIETGTAGLAWALAGSRARWMAGRVLPMAAALVVILAIPAVASELLLVARQPWVPPGQSLVDVDGHGFLLVVRGVAAFALALLVGAVLGRTLPAVIVAAALIATAGMTGLTLTDRWLRANVVYLADAVNAYTLPGGLNFGSMSRGVDGVVVSDEVALSLAPPGEDPFTWVAQNYESVYAAVPGSEYPGYMLVEGGAVGILIVLVGIATLTVVERRRPL